MSPKVLSDHLLPRTEEFRAPRPLRTTLLALTPGLVLAALWVIGVVPTGAAIGGGVLLGMAVVLGGHAWFDAWRCRRLADRLLRTHPGSTVPSPLADWRAAELTSQRTRRHLVKCVQSLIRETELCRRSPSPLLDGFVVEESLSLLHRLERRLGDPSLPVSPYGVLVVTEVVDHGASSPLYWPEGAADLPDALTRALAALDVPR